MRYLLQGKTGKVLAYTDALAKRTDMTEVTAEIANAIRANKPMPVQAQAPDPDEAKPSGQVPAEDQTPVGLSDVDTIMAFDDKTALEEWARAKGIELDRRKSLANLKQETLTALGIQTEG
jgi:hypothetical protein